MQTTLSGRWREMGEFADKLAVQSPAFQRAYLGSLAPSLVKSGNLEKYYQTLNNFDFLVAKIKHPTFGVQPLIEDYDLIDHEEILNYPEYNPEKVKSLKLIQGALRLSAHVLAVDKAQLASQLHGRLLNQKMLEEIQALLTQIKQQTNTPWLCPLTPSLTPPGGRLLRTLIGHGDWVKTVAVTPNGKQIISGSKDNTIKVWNLETGEEQFTLTGHTGSVNAVAVTPDGKLVISGSSDGNLKVWNLATGTEFIPVSGHRTPVVAITVTPDSKWVISVSALNIIKVWSLESGTVKFNLIGHTDLVRSIAVTPNGKCLISGSDDTTIKVWDLETGSELFSIVNTDGGLDDSADKVYAVAVTPNGKLLISGSDTNTIRVWNLEKPKKLFSLEGHSAPVVSFAVTPDSKQVVSASLDKTLKVWNLHDGKEIFSLAGHDGSLYTAIVTPDGNRLISGSKDKTLKIWDLKSEEENFRPNFYKSSVYASNITPNGKYAIFGLEDNILKVWSLENIEEIYSINEQVSKKNIFVIIRALWVSIIIIYYLLVSWVPLIIPMIVLFIIFVYFMKFILDFLVIFIFFSILTKLITAPFRILMYSLSYPDKDQSFSVEEKSYLEDKNIYLEIDESPVKFFNKILNEITSWNYTKIIRTQKFESLYKNVNVILLEKNNVFCINITRILKFYDLEKLQIKYLDLKLLKFRFYYIYFYIILPIVFSLTAIFFLINLNTEKNIYSSIFLLIICCIAWISSYLINNGDLVTAVILTPNGKHLIDKV